MCLWVSTVFHTDDGYKPKICDADCLSAIFEFFIKNREWEACMSSVVKSLTLACVVLFSGVHAYAGRFSDTPTMELCMDYMNKPSANFFHKSRAEELERRGEDCSKYGNAVDARARADARFDKSLDDMQKNSINSRKQRVEVSPVMPCQITTVGNSTTTTCY
jgi:hypothetical protein